MGTTRIVYAGPAVGVEIAATGQWVTKGGEADVDSELAETLLAQDIWVRAGTKAAATAAKEGRVSKEQAAAAAPAEPTTPEEG